MTSYNCFSDWAWGHIEYYYRDEEDILISDVQDGSILKVISKCAQEALCDFDLKEQDEFFGFTLEQVAQGELLQAFYINEILKEYPDIP
jgi:hypothetical protein